MARSIGRFADPARWRAYFDRLAENRRRRQLDNALDKAWAARGPVAISDGPDTVVADGMWYNPNHFLRLRLFVEARASRGPCRLLGVLRRRSDASARRALERIGFSDFMYLDEDAEFTTAGFHAEAARLLATVNSHSDFLALQLPRGLPAYIVYDSVLKLAKDPQPPLDNRLWRDCLAEALRDIAIYERELDRRKVTDVALSHPWKTEWGSLVWLALQRRIPAYHLTGFVEALRVRRFRTPDDYRNPVEHLPLAQFQALPAAVQAELSAMGAAELERRASGQSSDLNARYAYHPESRIGERVAARRALGGEGSRPIVVVYSHVWYDFPHTFGMSHFTDFRDWIEATLARVRVIDDVQWLIKPHPTEEWYGGFHLADIARDLPAHVKLLSTSIDNKTVLTAADCVVTVHGTVGLEAAAWGLPVVLADRSYFSDWNIAHVAADRADYLRLLGQAGRLEPPTTDQRDRARAAFGLALGKPPDDAGALPMRCDSQGTLVFEEVIGRARGADLILAAERDRLVRFLDQSGVDSFAAFHLIDMARRRVAGQR